MKRKWLLALGLFSIVLLVTGCSKTDSKETVGAIPLVVGMELAYPPFETKNAQDEPSGVSVDLAKDLGSYLNRPVTIVNTNWDGLIPSLQTGKVDVVISSMTITEQRSEVVDFSIPYAHSYLALLVNKEAGITSVEDLNKEGMVVDVKKGTTGYVYAKKYLTNAQVNALSSENACVTEVVQGRADAFIYDQLTIYRQNQANPKVTDAILIPFQESENWGMAVKKGNKALLTSINAFLGDYRKNGGFEKLTDKYLAEEKKTFDALDFPWFFTMEEK